jgi:hypothetical protein
VDVIAEHITLIDHYFFASINISEFENQNWTKTNEENNAAPNLSNISKRFNLFSSFVVYYIISSDNVKEKSNRYSKFANILEKLFNLNNFFSSRSIYAALKSVPIMVIYNFNNYFNIFYFINLFIFNNYFIFFILLSSYYNFIL